MPMRLNVGALLVVAAQVVLAQSQSPAALPQLVRTRVVVSDNQGIPVTNLTAQDFKIADQGKNMAVAYLHAPYIAHPEVAAAPGVVTSRAGQSAPGTTVIFLDLLNELQVNRLEAVRKFEKALPAMATGDGVYLYVLNLDGVLESLVPMQDGAKILAAPKDWHKNATALLDKTTKGLARPRPAGLLQEDVVKKTYVALETVATQLAAFPGARDILWVTDGVPSVANPRTPCSGDWVECSLYVPHLVVTLERAGVAVNTLSYGSGLSSSTTLAMEDVAGLTGGRTFFAEDLNVVVDRLAKAAGAAYFLAFAPASDAWDSKFRRLRVTCSKDGAKVHARQRYYGYPDQGQVPAIENTAMTSLLKITGDAPEIGLRGRIAASSKPGAMRVEIRIDPTDLLALEQGGNVLAQISVIYAQYGSNGLMGATPPQTFNLNLPRAQFEASKKDGLAFDQDIPVNPGAKSVRFVAYDRGSRFLGSVTLPVPAQK